MPRIDVECENGHQSEVYRSLAEYPNTPLCPECQAPTSQFHPQPRVAWTVDPIIVYQGPDGRVRFPGDASGAIAAGYERSGFKRIELRGAGEVRHFEKYMNKVEGARLQRRHEIRQSQREERERVNRSELRARMQSMSEFGRDLARGVMRRNDNAPRKPVGEAGFHSDVYSNSRSNRDESRDAQGRRRRD